MTVGNSWAARVWNGEARAWVCSGLGATCGVAALLTGCYSTGPALDRQEEQSFHAKHIPPQDSAGAPANATPQPLSVVSAQQFERDTAGAALVLDFERFAAGESLDGCVLCGMELQGATAELLVVNATETYVPPSADLRDSFNYRLMGAGKVLSPGGRVLAMGPLPDVENDDVTLSFDPPVSAAAFTLLSPSADGLSFTEVSVYTAGGDLLYKGQVDMKREPVPAGAQYPGPGSAFWGCVAADARISRIVIDEQDSNDVCPDSNIGFADIRFVPSSSARSDDLNGDGIVDKTDLAIVALFLASDDPQKAAWLDRSGWSQAARPQPAR